MTVLRLAGMLFVSGCLLAWVGASLWLVRTTEPVRYELIRLGHETYVAHPNGRLDGPYANRQAALTELAR